MNSIFYLGNYKNEYEDEKWQELNRRGEGKEEGKEEIRNYKPQDFIENYYYIFKVEIINKNKLKILDILHDYVKMPNIEPECILKYKEDFYLDGDFMFQIENLDDPVYFSKKIPWSTQFYIYRPFKNTKIVCLKTLETIKENIIKNNKILSEK